MPAMAAGLALLWAMGVWASAKSGVPVLLRACFVLPVLFYVPGHLLLRTMRIDLRGITEIVYAIATSWIILIFCGFLLHSFGALTDGGWTAAVGVTTASLALLAPTRKRARAGITMHVARPPLIPVAGFLVAALLATGAIWLATSQAERDHPFEVLELWMTEGDIPGEIRIGIRNDEPTERVFRLEVRGARRLIQTEERISLAPHTMALRTLNVQAPKAGGTERIEALLFDENGRLARRVHVSIKAAPKSNATQTKASE
jgi:hypothetical protein